MKSPLLQGGSSLCYQKLITSPDTEVHRCVIPELYLLIYGRDAPLEAK